MILTSVLMSTMILVAGDRPSDDAAKKDSQAMQGDWVLQSGEIKGGNKIPEQAAKTYRKSVQGNKYTVSFETEEGARSIGGTVTLDPAQNPKALDVVISDGDNKGQKMMGIYKIEGDTHTICAAPPGEKRPTAFDSQQGTLIVWKRVKK
jgi:uncharacterized protein (TIGR03067 family)